MMKAVFERGAFVPEDPCDLAEGTRVLLSILERPLVLPPETTDIEERDRILRETVKRMNRNPLPESAPRFSRDQMHERG